ESIPFQHCLPRPACHAAADLAAHGQQPQHRRGSAAGNLPAGHPRPERTPGGSPRTLRVPDRAQPGAGSSARAPYPVAHPDGRCAVGCDAECRAPL
ncbi:FIG006045: Sigma factor, ECF subfamily, partial [Pseudomonas sp. FEN]